jgi:hypothetical protein
MIQQADPMDTEGLSEICKYLIGKQNYQMIDQ